MENPFKHSKEDLWTLIERLEADNARLLSEQDRLIKERAALLAAKEKELALLYEENQQLRHRLNQLLQDKFGTKSEKDKEPTEETFDEAIIPDNVEEIGHCCKNITNKIFISIFM